MFIKQVLFPIAFLLLLGSCASNEIGESKDVAQDKIYQQYNVSYTEGEATASFRAQFRFAGRNGTTLVLSNPSKVSFDMANIDVDSSDGSGAYYKVTRPSDMLFASHRFVFTDVNGKSYENGFFMNEFRLSNLPANISRSGPAVIEYSFEPGYSLQGDDYIELESVNSDSSFSITVNKSDKQGLINIPASYLKKQKGKELELQATYHRRQPLKQVTTEGGDFEMRYALKPVKIALKD